MLSRTHEKTSPPVWLLGFANLPLGLMGGLALLTMPQWLAAQHVPEPVIAEMTTLALVPTFLVFLLGPIFDIWFSRRTYAMASTVVAACGAFGALVAGSNLALLGAALVCSLLGAAANAMARAVRGACHRQCCRVAVARQGQSIRRNAVRAFALCLAAADHLHAASRWPRLWRRRTEPDVSG